jgi:suppressor for copper-sensitivity B
MTVRVSWVGVCLCLAGFLPGYAWPQGPPQSEGAIGGFDDPLNLLQALDGFGGGAALDSTVAWTAGFELERGTAAGRLFVRANLKPGWHLYSTTQPRGGPQPTVIRLAATDAVELTGSFQPDRDPRIHADPAFPGVRVEEFYDDVTWSAPIRLAAGVDPQTLTVQVVIDGQVCATDGACLLVSDERVNAGFAGFYDPVEATGRFEDQAGHIVILGHVQPRVVAPGQTLELVLTAELAPSYHIYQLASVDYNKISKPTLIVLRKTSGWSYGTPQPSTPAKAEPSGLDAEPVLYYHEGTVSWTVPIQVPADAEPGDYELAGSMAFQTCTATSCDIPSAVDFSVTVVVGETVESGVRPLAFAAGSYSRTAQDAATLHRDSDTPTAEPATPLRTRFGDRPLVVILSLAFLAGLILNVMPCVLPVIGLKIMSFVQQAGGSRREILSLNLWFSFGLMAVFWILASVAVFAKLGWGEHFGDVRFLVTMIGIVFAFGLSFLGVWEIPIPGFVGGSTMQGVAQKEGPIGAFGKGVLSTVLATPCAGPLLVPAVSWAAAQPAGLTYLTFTSIGLGMASPYLLIGAFPRLIRVLPKPGAWMDTFKQIMGFLLMGTVVFLFNSLASEWVIPTLTLLLGIGIACWWIGRISVSAD